MYGPVQRGAEYSLQVAVRPQLPLKVIAVEGAEEGWSEKGKELISQKFHFPPKGLIFS